MEVNVFDILLDTIYFLQWNRIVELLSNLVNTIHYLQGKRLCKLWLASYCDALECKTSCGSKIIL